MEKTGLESKVYKAIATSLVEFGYKDAVASMIQDTHKAMCEGKREEELPHGIIGRFAQSQLEEAVEKGLINIPESK